MSTHDYEALAREWHAFTGNVDWPGLMLDDNDEDTNDYADFNDELNHYACIPWVRIECEKRWPGSEVDVAWMGDGTVAIYVYVDGSEPTAYEGKLEPSLPHAALALVRAANKGGE